MPANNTLLLDLETSNMRSEDCLETEPPAAEPPLPVSGLSVRAVNYEHQGDLEKLAELFASQTGPGKYQPEIGQIEYWLRKSRVWDDVLDGEILDERFVESSIVVVDNERFVAHLGLRYDIVSKQAEILLPIVNAEYRRQLVPVIHMLASSLKQLAVRQHWKSLFHFGFVTSPYSQLIAHRCFDAQITAIFPEPRQARSLQVEKNLRDNGFAQVAMYRVFPSAMSDPLLLFPPERHSTKIQELYHPLGLSRDFVHDGQSHHAGSSLPNDVIFECERQNVRQIFFQPSRISPEEFERILAANADMASAHKQIQAVQIALSDPGCPEFSRRLERWGYNFSGILPLVGNSDYLVYTRYDARSLYGLNFYGLRGNELRDYMLRHCQN